MTARNRDRVLVVEDDPLIRDVLTQVAQGGGFETSSAENGRDALSLATADEPDVVLLDLHMPVMDGASFAREYRRRGGRAPILVVSNCDEAGDDLRGIRIAGFVSKPFKLEDVERALAKTLHR